MGTRITGLNSSLGVDGTDQLAVAQGAEDYRVTVDELATFVQDTFTAADLLAKLLTVDSNSSTLNANFLQGKDANYFANAANLITGLIADARLPQGMFNTSWTSGGALPSEGTFKARLKIPQFIAGGPKIMIQFGWTEFIYDSQSVTTTFYEPFSSGFGGTDKPWVGVFPECLADGGSTIPYQRAELDIRLDYDSKTKSSFKCNSIRTTGSLGDTVRANWIAIGLYA